MIDEASMYLSRAKERLVGAESEFANGRYNNCANRSYYTCFQSAIAALIRAGIRPSGGRGEWSHSFVQSHFAGHLVHRRKRYPTSLRDTLGQTFVARTGRLFLGSREPASGESSAGAGAKIRRRGACRTELSGMSEEHFDETDPRIQAALAELRGLIQSAYPMASFSIEHGEDPPGILPIATVDVDDVDEVVDVFISRLVDIQVDEGLPVYVIPVEPLERSLAKPRASHAGEPIAEHAALATG